MFLDAPWILTNQLLLRIVPRTVLKRDSETYALPRNCSQTHVNQAMQRNQSQPHTQAKAYGLLHLYLLSSKPYTRTGSIIIDYSTHGK